MSISECKTAFGPQNVAILSNSGGSSDDVVYENGQKIMFREAQMIEKELQIPVIRHPHNKKPQVFNEIVHHFTQKTDIKGER